jgi:hypothetical protein
VPLAIIVVLDNVLEALGRAEEAFERLQPVAKAAAK